MSDERQYWFFRKEVAGTLAMWAIRQSPYLVPEGLTEAVHAMHDALPDEMGGMFSMSDWQLQEEVQRICRTDPIIAAWNEPKSGHGASMVFSSRYDQPHPDDDFIDLDALANNITRTLLADQDDYAAQAGVTRMGGDGEAGSGANGGKHD